MPWLIERWLSGARWVRVVTFASITSMATLAAGLLLLLPQHSQIQQLQANSEQMGQQLAELRHKIRQLTALEQPISPSNPPLFSVTEFVRQAGGQLVKWQPDDKSAVLNILVPWEKLPELFIRLAEYRIVAEHSFTITAQGELLNLVLTMEFTDDS
ncbi:MAG TPA: hypothetical protein VJY99_15135 [Buttiauxella sp.]|uniref:HofO family protein n=1 Tax=Buttiauxella sp. TaxID=1972222 RepID=UPI002B462BF9|nr:hypothetical protein [Buttiauxella sp.]HKM98010.1 hypothetical protein [Buttiauxella sp.]